MKIVRLASPLPDVLRLSSPRLRLRLRLRHGSCSSLSPKSKSDIVYLLLRFVAGSFSSSPNFPKLFLSRGVGFGLCRLPEIPLLCLLGKGPAKQSQKLSFQAPPGHVSRGVSLVLLLPSPPLNFLRLPLISPGPLPLLQTKLPIPC